MNPVVLEPSPVTAKELLPLFDEVEDEPVVDELPCVLEIPFATDFAHALVSVTLCV
jgi:hypothetical protein